MLLLTVIVPFFNEEKFLKASVERLIDQLKKNNIRFEVKLVNDSSTDKSYKIAKEISLSHKNITLLNKNKNEGKGSCIKIINKSIDSDFVIIHDADLEYYPQDMVEMFNIAVNNPTKMVLGSRVIGEKNRTKKYNFLVLINLLFAKLFSILNFYKVTDISTGYMMFPTEFFRSIDIESDGFTLEIELLSKFIKSNREIIETPIAYSGRTYNEGKKIKFSDGLSIFFMIFFSSKVYSVFRSFVKRS